MAGAVPVGEDRPTAGAGPAAPHRRRPGGAVTAWPETLPRPTALRDEELAEYDATRRLTAERLAAVAAAGPEGRLDRALIAALAGAGLVQRLFPASHGGSQPGEVSAVTCACCGRRWRSSRPRRRPPWPMQGLGAYPILQSGRRRAGAPLDPGDRHRPGGPRLRPDRARRRLGRRRRSTWRPSPTATAGGSPARRHGSPTPPTPTSTPCSPAPPKGRAPPVSPHSPSPATPRGCRAAPLELVAPHPIGSITFDGVFVPADHLLGEPDRGFAVAMRTLDRFRPSVGAFARRDGAGGARSGDRPRRAAAGVRRSVCATCRRWGTSSPTWRPRCTAPGCWSTTRPAPSTPGPSRSTIRASMAKLAATEMAQRVVDDAVQIHGARALERGHLLERLYRDGARPADLRGRLRGPARRSSPAASTRRPDHPPPTKL